MFPGCDKPVRARGWCSTHHRRWLVHGDVNVVLDGGRQRWGDPEERFWSLIDKRPSGCWPWLGARNSAKRGAYGIYRGRYAHRVVWEKLRGPIPPGMVLDHLCRNHQCVNPDHLRIITRAENADSNRRKTHCPAGHEYDEANTYWDRKGGRRCRACARERYHRRKGTMTLADAQRQIVRDWGPK